MPPPILEQPLETNLDRDFWTGVYPELHRKLGQGLSPNPGMLLKSGMSSSAKAVPRRQRAMAARDLIIVLLPFGLLLVRWLLIGE